MSDLVTLERWKVVLAAGLSLLLGLLVGFLVERGRVSSAPTASALPTATATVVATPTPAPTPTATPSPTAAPTATPTAPPPPSAPPTPAPTLAAPPGIGNGSSVFSSSGSGNGGPFTLPALNDNWGLAYSLLCSGSGQFNVTVLVAGSPTNSDPPFAAIGSNVQGAQQYAKGGPTLQMQVHIDGSCQWRVSVYNGTP